MRTARKINAKRSSKAEKKSLHTSNDTEKKYKALFEQSPYGILLIDAEGKILDFNETAHRDLGYTREEFANITIADLDPVESSVEVKARISRILEKGSAEFETRHRTKQGEIRDVHVITKALTLSGQTLLHSIWRDITDYRQSEIKLKNSEGRLNTILDNVGAAIFIKDTQYRYRYANRKVCEIFGRSSEDIIGKSDKEFFSSESVEEIVRSDRPVIERGETVTREETELTSSDKVPRTYWTVKLPLRDSSGTITGLCGISTDITERKKAEEEIRIFASLVDAAPAAITVHDSDGAFLYANQTAFDIHGYSREEFLSLNLQKLDTPESAQLIAMRMQQIMEKGQASFEVEHYRKDGSIVSLYVYAKILEWGGKKVILSVASDITEINDMRHRLEEKTAEQNAILENTLAGIAFLKDRKFIWINSKMEDMFGYDRSEVSGLTTEVFYPSHESYEQLGKDAYPLLASGQTYSTERLMKRKDSSVFLCSLSGKAIDPSALSKGSIWILQDINERKQAEEKLIYIMKAVESTSDAIGISDSLGHHFYQNKALSELFEYTNAEELEAAGGGPAVVKDPQVAKEMFDAIMDGKSWVGELEMVTKSGRVFPAFERADSIKDNDGNLIGLIGIITDITERKKAEETLLNFRMAVDSATDAIGMSTPEGRHYYQNEAFTKLFGLSVSEVDGVSGPPATVYADEKVGAKIFEAIMQGGAFAGEVKMLDKDRNERDIYLRAYSIKSKEGKVVGLVGTHTDITERKKAEEILKSALIEKETLLRELYHRTKNNMQVITSLLNLQAYATDDKKTLEVIEDTKNRIFSMSLVHEKLYKAKDLSRVNLRDYIPDLAASLMDSYQISKGKISLLLDIDDIPVSIDTITPCGLVINELMTNTLKYAFPDNSAGKITISAHLNTKGIIELRFSDDGVGLPGGIDLRNPESLGLKIVHTLVETQLKGKMLIESAHGAGFVISFKEIDKVKRI